MAAIKKRVGRTSSGLLNSQTFDLLLSRLDDMETRSHQRFDALEKVFSEHKKADDLVHTVVTKHATYWNFTKVALTTLVPGGGLAALIAWWYK